MSAYTCMMDFIHSGCYEILRSRSVLSRYMDMYVDGVVGTLGIINLQFFFSGSFLGMKFCYSNYSPLVSTTGSLGII